MPTDLTPSRLPGSRIRRFRRLARLGFAVNGLLHLVIGAIAIRLAFGDTSAVEADPSGAIARLTGAPLGSVAIWAAFSAVLALGLWQLTIGGASDSPRRAARWGRRVVEAGKGWRRSPWPARSSSSRSAARPARPRRSGRSTSSWSPPRPAWWSSP
ncbi:DUF1206 domain-containing protein [Rathayibacter oskolensis]|uniref:DUF1206 domain-containing protein n=1 Tax=Rathayibacter oskolensis TaxID=1891671 RepID=UPI00265F5F2A|nr:DUF1206 domain-containing protein [Rathayibacter oskolensis]WKK70503.1 DUF1206 domain-containing protein [Rathayibacter oskolensis]